MIRQIHQNLQKKLYFIGLSSILHLGVGFSLSYVFLNFELSQSKTTNIKSANSAIAMHLFTPPQGRANIQKPRTFLSKESSPIKSAIAKQPAILKKDSTPSPIPRVQKTTPHSTDKPTTYSVGQTRESFLAKDGFVQPTYPRIASRRRLEGTVILEIELSRGKIVSIKTKSSSGHESLDKEALETIQKWKFKPLDIKFDQLVTFRMR